MSQEIQKKNGTLISIINPGLRKLFVDTFIAKFNKNDKNWIQRLEFVMDKNVSFELLTNFFANIRQVIVCAWIHVNNS